MDEPEYKVRKYMTKLTRTGPMKAFPDLSTRLPGHYASVASFIVANTRCRGVYYALQGSNSNYPWRTNVDV